MLRGVSDVLAVWDKRLFELLIVLLLGCGLAGAQREVLQAAPAVETTVDAVLHGMVVRAGVIFVGTVVDVRRRVSGTGGGGSGVGSGVVEVEFAVDQGLRDAITGHHYVLREWGGLWEGNDERYRVGERRLMLLHAPGAGGLSSPVSGMDGAIPIRPGADDRAEPLVDLRWVAARVSHGPVQYRVEAPRIPKARPMVEVLHLPGEVTSVADGEAARVVSERRSAAADCASVSSVVAAIVRWKAEPR